MILVFTFLCDYLSQIYKLPKDRIYATYFGGDEKAGLAPDDEARHLWLKFLPPGRVLPFGCKVRSNVHAVISLRCSHVATHQVYPTSLYSIKTLM